jgi:hypothetical protein
VVRGQAAEEAVFMGDRSFSRVLRGLAREPAPLISLDKEPRAGCDQVDVEVTLAPAGREVLRGRLDWVALPDTDRWHNGGYLVGGEVAWRWHPGERRIVPLPTRSQPA